MYTYAWYHWITFFFLYCFFGWIFESTYVSLKSGRFVNRGFLRLPMLPLYGTGAVMMLWVSLPVKDNLVLVYLSGVIAATILEYVTGYVMERLFKVKYWDYSNQKFNLHGYICLTSSIAWGFLTILMTEVLHKPVERLVLGMNPVVEFAFIGITGAMFTADAIQSTREALNLARLLEAMTKMRAELEELQVQIALMKAEAAQKAQELKAQQQAKFVNFRPGAPLKIATGHSRRLMTEARFQQGRLWKAAEDQSERFIRAAENRSDRFIKAAGDRSERFVKAAGERSGRFVKAAGDQSGRFVKAAGERSGRFVKAAGDQSERFIKAAGDQSGRFAKAAGDQSGRFIKAAGSWRDATAQKMAEFRENSHQKPAIPAELTALTERLRELTEKRQKLTHHMTFYRKGILRGNPGATSRRFADALKELRDIVGSK